MDFVSAHHGAIPGERDGVARPVRPSAGAPRQVRDRRRRARARRGARAQRDARARRSEARLRATRGARATSSGSCACGASIRRRSTRSSRRCSPATSRSSSADAILAAAQDAALGAAAHRRRAARPRVVPAGVDACCSARAPPASRCRRARPRISRPRTRPGDGAAPAAGAPRAASARRPDPRPPDPKARHAHARDRPRRAVLAASGAAAQDYPKLKAGPVGAHDELGQGRRRRERPRSRRCAPTTRAEGNDGDGRRHEQGDVHEERVPPRRRALRRPVRVQDRRLEDRLADRDDAHRRHRLPHRDQRHLRPAVHGDEGGAVGDRRRSTSAHAATASCRATSSRPAARRST